MNVFSENKLLEEESIEVWNRFSIEESLNASFVLPFFEKHKNGYVKIFGYRKGLKIRQEDGFLRFEKGDAYDVSLLTGLWFNPFNESLKLCRNAKNIIERFLEIFPGLGIAINPWDRLGMFYTVFLSRNTDYYRNTVNWMKKIFREAEHEDKLGSLEFSRIGRSYQLRNLSQVREIVNEIFQDELVKSSIFSIEEFYEIRKKMLSVKFCGPKIVHGWGLFSLGLTCLSQVDRHLLKIGEVLGLTAPEDKPPLKTLCASSKCFTDGDCRIADRCITYKLYKIFGEMAGWFQTATYLYGAKYLSRGRDPAKILRK